ncbi:gamma-glutamylcyclotransferase family protein [Thermoflavimicrobium daqui]|uniref:Gamma-glutamylcyclotransferase family protein n=1 Tax=Thermoflavimicrobium daqui TaxID=2137476 RepID=A0A364K908_9BACL|nr:gamma-glutamylcyclotransferase [Thermoflavimicrobium daqui]RAL26702.1 gamma-L-glutamyl-butirosin B gamma-glutamyl cyclotransferase [Thermoflavimicrobium daqui]
MNLFVYGSLRKGMKYHHLLQGAKLITLSAWIRGLLYDTRQGYPGLTPGNGHVIGEIYHINKQILKRVDQLEDYYGPQDPRNLYERNELYVNTKEYGKIRSFVYTYKMEQWLKQKGIYITEGDWVQYMTKG